MAENRVPENTGDQVSQLSSAVATAVARALQQQIPTESGPGPSARCECRVTGGIGINRSSITPNRYILQVHGYYTTLYPISAEYSVLCNRSHRKGMWIL